MWIWCTPTCETLIFGELSFSGPTSDMRGWMLDAADLKKSNLQFTNLRAASLRGADLRGSTLYGTDLRQADLSGARLNDGALEQAYWQGAHGIKDSVRSSVSAWLS